MDSTKGMDLGDAPGGEDGIYDFDRFDSLEEAGVLNISWERGFFGRATPDLCIKTKRAAHGTITPEQQLRPMIFGGFIIPLCDFYLRTDCESMFTGSCRCLLRLFLDLA